MRGESNRKRPGLSLLTAAVPWSPSPAANAATAFVWGPADDQGATMVPQPRKREGAAHGRAGREKSMPEGPLIVAISIQHQHVKVFDVNGLFAECPISTGMPGHSTPMGVFSVIEKQRAGIARTFIAARRCPTCSASPGPASRCTKACCRAIRRRMAASACPGAFAVKMFGGPSAARA